MPAKDTLEHWVQISTVGIFFLSIVGAIVGVVVAYYSVQTARAALAQASQDLRPWLTFEPETTEIEVSKGRMDISVAVRNVGKTGVYATTTFHQELVGAPPDEQVPAGEGRTLAVMPGNTHGVTSWVSNPLLQDVMDGKYTLRLHVRVSYGPTRKQSKRYYLSQILEFDAEEAKRRIRIGKPETKAPGLWVRLASDWN